MSVNLRYICIMTMAFITIVMMPFYVSAQTQDNEPANVAERIESESGGNVDIEIPDDILNQLLKQETVRGHGGPALRPGLNKVSGYRVQVFSDGRHPTTLESRAKARGSAIVARFPKYRGQVYTHSSAPNWYTRIGNFKSSAEAASAMAELKRAFPQFASEMRVVKSQIVVIK